MISTLSRAALLCGLLLASALQAAAGIDQAFEKEAERPSWGELFQRAIGRGSYGKSYALVIGISTFDDHRKLPTEQDPIRVKDFLMDQAGFDYVHVLTEEKVTSARVQALMTRTFRAKITDQDRFIFYWSGHGETVTNRAGELVGFFPLKDSQKNDVPSMLPMNSVRQWGDDWIAAKQVLYLLDACFSGHGGLAAQSDPVRLRMEDMARPSRHILTAGTADEKTFAVEAIQGGIFTRAVLDGLAGAADLAIPVQTDAGPVYQTDGIISVNELEVYVKNRVATERSRWRWNEPVSPQLYDMGVNQGEFFFVTPTRWNAPPEPSQPVPDDTTPAALPMGESDTGSTILFSSEEVQEAQELLSILGFDVGPPDGFWGPRTQNAIRRFMSSIGREAEAVLTPESLELMRKEAASVIATGVFVTGDVSLSRLIDKVDTFPLRVEDLAPIQSADEIRALRNSLLARGGYAFKDSSLATEFQNASWYKPTTFDLELVYERLSGVQRANLALIKQYEDQRFP